MIKRLNEHKEYQESLKEVEKQRVRCENQTKLFEQYEKDNLNLEDTLGIEKAGQIPDFESITKSKEKTRIAKREMDIANEKLLSLEEKLKETIEKVKNLRKIEIKKEGLKLNKKILKIFNTIEQSREKYRILKREIKKDFEEELELEGGYRAVIGADPTYVDFSNRLSYPSASFIKNSTKYQSKEKDKIKDI